MSFLKIENPETSKSFEATSFYEYIKSNERSSFEIEFTKESPTFEIERDMNFSSLTIHGGLLKYPICGKPKVTFFNNFYSMKENKFTIYLKSKIEDDAINEYEDNYEYRYDRISLLNKKYNTKYKRRSSINNDLNYGAFYPFIPQTRRECNEIIIYNSYPKYLNFLYDTLLNHKKDLTINFAIQDIKEWEDFYPIIDLGINGWGREIEEIISDEYFSYDYSDTFPSQSKILVESV